MSTFTVAPPCDLINANDRLHYRPKADRTRQWREAAYRAVECRDIGCCSLERAHITVAIRFPTNHRRDVGNYYPTAKAIVDGCVDAGLIPDDNDQHVVGPDMRREYPNGPLRITVTLEEIQ